MKRIYILPNLFTTANLIFGFSAMVYSSKGDFIYAAWLIVAAGVCDLLDGRIARLAKATSPFGVQYDSLSDLTSFGIAPGILLYHLALSEIQNVKYGIGIASIYVVCAALRLARFNVTTEVPSAKVRKGYFQGMPSPVAAGLVVTSVLFRNELEFLSLEAFRIPFIALTVTCGVFMVSNIPFPSFKEVKPKSAGNVLLMLAFVVAFIFSIQDPAKAFFPIGCIYLFGSLFWSVYICWFKPKPAEVNRA